LRYCHYQHLFQQYISDIKFIWNQNRCAKEFYSWRSWIQSAIPTVQSLTLNAKSSKKLLVIKQTCSWLSRWLDGRKSHTYFMTHVRVFRNCLLVRHAARMILHSASKKMSRRNTGVIRSLNSLKQLSPQDNKKNKKITNKMMMIHRRAFGSYFS